MRNFNLGYYHQFILPENIEIPENLKVTLQYIWNRKYDDLYEVGGNSDLEEAFEELLETFGKPDNIKQHRRSIYLAWAMALATQSIIKHYYPNDNSFYQVEKQVKLSLIQGYKNVNNLANQLFPNINKIGKYQAVDEAYNILYNCLQTLDPELAYQSVLDILYDGITGEAIAGFSLPKRDIFNWLLIEVIPYAYCLQLPPHIYSEKYQIILPQKVC